MWFQKKIVLLLLTVCSASGAIQEHIDRYFNEAECGEQMYLLSYPRSGNSLVRYLIEFVTKRPTLSFQRIRDKINSPLGICLHELQTNFAALPVWKVHTAQKIVDQCYYSAERTKVILVIRNYKENLFRESRVWSLELFDQTGNLRHAYMRAIFSWYCPQNRMCRYDPDYSKYGNTGTQLYFDNITFFDQLPDENKLLLYYEDLIQDPEAVVHKICDFCGCSYEYIPILMADYDRYKKSILAFYPENKTSGSEKIHYSKKYSLEQRKQIDAYVQQEYPLLWKKYLQRYAEKK